MPMIIAGVMGPGEGATERECATAYRLGQAIAREGWTLLTGGRGAGVMDAASRGAKEAGGLTVGVLPSSDRSGLSRFVDIPIVTGIGEARNYVNVLSSDVMFACGMGAGTASEVALALKSGRQVILVDVSHEATAFFGSLGKQRIHSVTDVVQAIETARSMLAPPSAVE
jgi:uncharacterized protein (TIGR00725 family)